MENLNLQYWRLEGDFAIFKMESGSDYDIYLPAETDWVTHVRDKRWATKPVVDELRSIIKAYESGKEAKV